MPTCGARQRTINNLGRRSMHYAGSASKVLTETTGIHETGDHQFKDEENNHITNFNHHHILWVLL